MTGSLYSYCEETKEWARLSKTDGSGELRDESGTCLHVPDIEMGQSVHFVMNHPSGEKNRYRVVSTSMVEEILQQEQEAA